MRVLKVLLAVIVFWLVNQIHLPSTFGIRGLNSMNLLVIAAVMLILFVERKPVVAGLGKLEMPLKWPILFFFFTLGYALIIGLLYDRTYLIEDFTVFKTGVFYIGLYFVFYFAVQDVKTIYRLVAVILLVAALAGLEAMREALDYGLAAYSESKRAAGPFGTDYKASNLAAVFFCIFLPLFVAVGFYLRDRPFYRFAAMGGAALLIFAIFFTYSRQAYLIVAIVLLLMALRKNLVLGLLISMAIWNYDLWVPNAAVERVQMTTQSTSSDFGKTTVQVDHSTASRFDLWQGGARMIQDKPLGIGLNHWKREISNYSAYTNLDAHNFYVLISAEAGVLGMISISWLIAALLLFARRNMRLAQSPEAKTLAYGFMGATLALIMGNFYGSRFLNGEVVGNYWVLAALVARYFQLASLAAAAPDATAEQAAAVQLTARPATRSASGRRLAGAGAPSEDEPMFAQAVLNPQSNKPTRDQNGRLLRS